MAGEIGYMILVVMRWKAVPIRSLILAILKKCLLTDVKKPNWDVLSTYRVRSTKWQYRTKKTGFLQNADEICLGLGSVISF